MAPISTEANIDCVKAAKIIPGRPSSDTVWRWMTKGVKLPNGERLRLDHIRVGGKLFTTETNVRDFIAANTAAHVAAADAPPPVKSKTVRRVPQTRRQKQIADARRELSSR